MNCNTQKESRKWDIRNKINIFVEKDNKIVILSTIAGCEHGDDDGEDVMCNL